MSLEDNYPDVSAFHFFLINSPIHICTYAQNTVLPASLHTKSIQTPVNVAHTYFIKKLWAFSGAILVCAQLQSPAFAATWDWVAV